MIIQVIQTGIIILALILGALLDGASGMGNEPVPECWEDEVLVLVVVDPYGLVDESYGCVPADNLPVTGYRPTNPN